MATLEEARRAKKTLANQLGTQSWLRGIGVAGEYGDYSVRVNIGRLPLGLYIEIPEKIDGVDVVIVEIGEILPQDEESK